MGGRGDEYPDRVLWQEWRHRAQGNERQGSDELGGLTLGSVHHLQRQDH